MSRTVNVREKYPDLPWHEMTGMRNKLIHEYFRINIDEVWKTIESDLPELKNWLEGI